MQLGGFKFKPALLPSLVTALLLALLLALGFWQLDRARQKQVLQAVFAEQSARPQAALAELDVSLPSSYYRKISLSGRYDSEHQILLDNQIVAGRPGYHVLTPLWLADREAAILVNRGWLAQGISRAQLPDVSLLQADVQLFGRLGRPANPGMRLGPAAAVTAWPQVTPYLDYDEQAALLGYPLLPAVVLLDPDQANGYRRDWQPDFGGFGPDRHRGYAVQWFGLALTLVVIYLSVNLRREEPR